MNALALGVACATLPLGAAAPAHAAIEDLLRAQGFSSVPLEPVPGRSGMRVRATINGHEFRLLVDTGATTTTLFGDAAQKAGIPVERTLGPAYGVNGPTDSTTAEARITSFVLGGQAMPATPVRLVTFHRTIINRDEPIDGLLGLATLRRLHAVFGCGWKSLFFKADEPSAQGLGDFFRAAGYAAAAPRFDRGRYLLPAKVNDLEITLALDSGAGATFLDQRLAASAGLQVTPGLRWGVGLDGNQIPQNQARCRSFSVAGIDLLPAPVDIGNAGMFHHDVGVDCGGLLGFEPLSAARAYLDAGNDRLYLDPRPGRTR